MSTDYGYGVNGNGRPLGYDDYVRLRGEMNAYRRQQQQKDPEWAAWWKQADAQNLDTFGSIASPTTDYNKEFLGKLPPEVQADFYRHMADSKDWGDTVGGVLKYAVPALVGGAGLAATGLLGSGLQAAVGGAPLGGTAATGGGGLLGWDAAMADLAQAGGLTGESLAAAPTWDAATAAAWSQGAPGLGLDTVSAVGGGSSISPLLKTAIKAGGSLLSGGPGATGGGGSGGAMPMGRNGVAMDPALFRMPTRAKYAPTSGLQALYESSRKGLL